MALEPDTKEEIVRMIKEEMVIPTLQIGIVKNVKIITLPQGGRVAKVDVQSFTDMQIIQDIPIDQPLNRQFIPIVGQQVVLLRMGDIYTRILLELSERPFAAVEDPGEILIEGLGGGFFYANNGGDVYLSDEIRGNMIQILSLVGIKMIGRTLSIVIKDTGKITITPKDDELQTEDKIEFEKINKTGDPTKVTITNDRVEIEAPQVSIGRTGPKAGSVVSFSPRVGDHSIDPMTGDPIPRSATVVETVGTPADLIKHLAADAS